MNPTEYIGRTIKVNTPVYTNLPATLTVVVLECFGSYFRAKMQNGRNILMPNNWLKT
jgi:hypothetical protein